MTLFSAPFTVHLSKLETERFENNAFSKGSTFETESFLNFKRFLANLVRSPSSKFQGKSL